MRSDRLEAVGLLITATGVAIELGYGWGAVLVGIGLILRAAYTPQSDRGDE